LVIYKNYTEMLHGQQNIRLLKSIRRICNKSGNYTHPKLVVVAAVVVVECYGTTKTGC